MKTPDWIMGGYGSKADWEKAKGISSTKRKGKTFKIRECPKCKSDEVGVVVGQEKKGDWECKKCKWAGVGINEEELSEEEFMKYLDDNGEEVA